MPRIKLTNKHGLPESICSAVANDPYTRGASDISVTKLITPAYQQHLFNSQEEIEEDVADRIYSLVGQIGHTILERSDQGDALVEERLFMPVGDWTVSGQFDRIEGPCLMDFKFTSVWSIDGKIEWEQQLNLLRLLAHHRADETGDDRYRVEELAIIAVFRDWSKSKARRGEHPPVQVKKISIDVWPIERAREYMHERVAAHRSENPPPCTDEERWARPGKHAVMKKGAKRATKLFDARADAEAFAADLGGGAWVDSRPSSYVRCEDYCSVSDVCPAFKDVIF